MTKSKIAVLLATLPLAFAAGCSTATNENKPANLEPPVNTSKPANLAPANTNTGVKPPPANTNTKPAPPPPKPSATKKP